MAARKRVAERSVRRAGRSYIPDRGHLIWLTFTPQAGHEQAGRRPALVVSPVAYNDKSGLALVCPVTSRVKGYPFEVRLPSGASARGVVLADQVRSLDWRARDAEFLGDGGAILDEVLGKLEALLFG